MTDFIGAAIAEANTNTQPEADVVTPEATLETPEAEPSEAQPAEAKHEEMFPKKAVNAISRRDKTIGKLREQIAQLKAQTQPKQEVVNGIPKTLPNGEPNPEAYDTYDELTKARIRHEANQTITESTIKQKETEADAMEAEWIQERNAVVDADVEAFAKEQPEFIQLLNQNAEIIKNAPDAIKNLFREADKPALALFNLAKAGRLAELASMTPTQAAREIGRAESQAISKPKTKAPTPLPASRGSVPAGKPMKDFSPREALDFLTPKD